MAALFDLRDAGVLELNSEEAKNTFADGDEERIHIFASSQGFIKLGRRLVEFKTMTRAQLQTLIELLEFCPNEDELGFVFDGETQPRYYTVERIRKAKVSKVFEPTS